MDLLQRVMQQHLAGLALAIPSLLILSACSQSNTPLISGSTGQGSTVNGSPTLPTELPPPYNGWKQKAMTSACSIDPLKPTPDGGYVVNGYGIINAAKGETPEVFILEIQGGGKKLYALTDIVERKDVAARLSNASLNFSGFTGFIPPKAISKPFTVSMLQGFRNKFFPCKNTLVVK